MAKTRERVGVKLARENIRILCALLGFRHRGFTVRQRHDFLCTARKRGDDGCRGKQNIQHHDDLAGKSLVIKFFLLKEHVNFWHCAVSRQSVLCSESSSRLAERQRRRSHAVRVLYRTSDCSSQTRDVCPCAVPSRVLRSNRRAWRVAGNRWTGSRLPTVAAAHRDTRG